MQPTSNPSDIRKLTVELPKFLDEWVGNQATLHLTGGAVTMAGTILPGRNEQVLIGNRWHYYGSIIVRDATEDVEVDFLSVVRAV